MSTGAKRVATMLKVFGFAAVGVVVLVTWLVIDPPETDDSATVAAPDAEMSAQTVAELAQASAAQGVCYGWRLDSGGSAVSEGSNLGPGVAVDREPDRCPRWVVVHASVWYTAASSEAADSASVGISASGVTAPLESRLDRFGITTDAFVAEPDWAICQAALVLPLLMAEEGTVPPAPGALSAASDQPSEQPSVPPAAATPLPAAGSDFWRDRWGYVLGGALLLVVAILTVAIGWFERQHQRRAGTPTRSAARRTGAPATTPRT